MKGTVIAALLISLSLVFLNVIGRTLFHAPLTWSGDVVSLCMMVMSFCGVPVAYLARRHIAVATLAERAPPRYRPHIVIVQDITILLTSVLLCYLSVGNFEGAWQSRMTVIGIRQSWNVLPMILGFGATAVFSAMELAHQSRRRLTLVALPILGLAAAGAVLLVSTPLVLGAYLVIALCLFVVLVGIGVPIAFCFAAAAALYVTPSRLAPPTIITLTMNHSLTSFLLVAVPFFILAGALMTKGGLSEPLARFVIALVGHLRGGLMQVIILIMCVFSGISGVKVADVAAVGQTMGRVTSAAGYPSSETAATIAAAAAMGETIPPSVAMLILASVTTLSVGALFVAGIIPAAALAILLNLAVYIRARKSGRPAGSPFAWRAAWSTGIRAFPALLLPVILLLGIVSGIATPTEASSIAVVYGLLIAGLVYRKLTLRVSFDVLSETAIVTGSLMMIVGAASSFSWVLTAAEVPVQLTDLMARIGNRPWILLLATLLIMVLMGSFFEGTPALLVLGPLLLPLAVASGINELHFGIVLIVAMGIGFFAPPIGVGLHVACTVCETTVDRASRPLLPLLAILVAGVLIITFVPQVTLALPHLLNLN